MNPFREAAPPPEVSELRAEHARLSKRVVVLRAAVERKRSFRRWKRAGLVLGAVVLIELAAVLVGRLARF